MRRCGAWLALCLCLSGSGGAAAAELRLEGALVQGGLVHGQTAPGSTVWLDGRRLRVAADGRFAFGFGRDAPSDALLVIRAPGGDSARRHLAIAARSYRIQRIDGLPPSEVTPSEAELVRIEADAKLIAVARAHEGAGRGFAEPVAWPLRGRISAVYGSQRILNGEPRAPHRGLDIAAARGTPVGAMASGVVSLAANDLFLTGGTVMVDHGHGVQSLYAHLQDVLVEVGQHLEQGEQLGTVGASGRATGPHLHWGVSWFEEALDPALLVGRMTADAW
jgi:murein DD-endopeptidase MepM/ murein hydrolase activator NlpD